MKPGFWKGFWAGWSSVAALAMFEVVARGAKPTEHNAPIWVYTLLLTLLSATVVYDFYGGRK